MFGQLYTHDELNKYIAIFGSLFNNIVIPREVDGETVQRLHVPITYGPREKSLARTESDPELNRPYAEIVPRMTFEITGMEYDSDRKRASNRQWRQKVVHGDQRVSFNAMYMPVPFIINFKLTIHANRRKDAYRIVTNIIPNFRPDITVSASIVDNMPDYVLDIPIIYKGMTNDDEYDGEYTKLTKTYWELDFVMKCEIFGPVTEAKIIKIAKVNLYADVHGQFEPEPDETITVQPGLTIDGKPTSNAELSVPVYQIDKDDDWGYVTIITSK